MAKDQDYDLDDIAPTDFISGALNEKQRVLLAIENDDSGFTKAAYSHLYAAKDTRNAPKEKAKRAARLKALEQALDRKIGLSDDRLNARLEITRQQIESLQLLAGLSQELPIYCKKTGMELGTVNAYALAACNEIAPTWSVTDNNGADHPLNDYFNSHVHPAWLETSPEKLRNLQRLMPAEYIVYCAGQLLHTTDQAAYVKNEQLRHIRAHDLRVQVSVAELLRMALALFGRRKLTHGLPLPALPRFYYQDLAQFDRALRDWIKAMIFSLQKQKHNADLDRRPVVTMAEIDSYCKSYGFQLFKAARIARQADDTTFFDLAEIFKSDDQLKLTIGTQTAAPVEEKKPQFKGKVFKDQTPKRNGAAVKNKLALPPIKLF